jgi:HlyD family secretion protein
MTKKRKIVFFTLAPLVLGGAALAYDWLGAEEEAPLGRPHTVERGVLLEMASASGAIEPNVQVEVKSRASGEVVEVLVEEGQTVEAGQLLFRLDPVDADRAMTEARTAAQRVRSELAQAQASLNVSMAEARNAEAQHAVSSRGMELGLVASESTRGAASGAEVAAANVELRRAAVQAGRAQLAAARLAVEESERRRSETEIHAPIAGTVLNVAVERGSIVASAVTNVGGGSALATIADLSDLRVIGAIDEAQIGKLRVGQEAILRVNAYPDRGFTGRVIRVSPLGETTSNVVTFDVEILVTDEESALLRSGMSADIEIETNRLESVLLVPLVAIESVGPRRYVTLASGERREIETSANDGVHIVVTSGLVEGDRIVIGGRSRRESAPGSKSLIPMRGRRGRR